MKGDLIYRSYQLVCIGKGNYRVFFRNIVGEFHLINFLFTMYNNENLSRKETNIFWTATIWQLPWRTNILSGTSHMGTWTCSGYIKTESFNYFFISWEPCIITSNAIKPHNWEVSFQIKRWLLLEMQYLIALLCYPNNDAISITIEIKSN